LANKWAQVANAKQRLTRVAGGHRRRDPIRVRRLLTPRYGFRNSSGSFAMFAAIGRP
jgi:hypothetical protein